MVLGRLLDGIDTVLDTLASPFLPKKQEDGDSASHPESPSTSSIVVNGVVIPKLVADQLQKLGVSLSFYSEHELNAAIQACAIDCTLIDDNNATDFYDALELDEQERATQNGTDPFDPHKRHALPVPHVCGPCSDDEHEKPGFCERLEAEREKKSNSSHLHYTGN